MFFDCIGRAEGREGGNAKTFTRATPVQLSLGHADYYILLVHTVGLIVTNSAHFAEMLHWYFLFCLFCTWPYYLHLLVTVVTCCTPH